MTRGADTRVTVLMDASFVPFGEFRIQVKEPIPQTRATDRNPRHQGSPPYTLPTSTGNGYRLVFAQGASG